MHQHEQESRLVALGANVAGLADAAFGLGIAMLAAGAGATRRMLGTVTGASPVSNHCGCGFSCGCQTIRHHHCCQCVPPCYRCGC